MAATRASDVTRLLVDWQGGDKLALEELMPLVYRELRKSLLVIFDRSAATTPSNPPL
jgi:hypothetical protein